MRNAHIFQYAEAQARIRARIGVLPTNTQWRYIADAADLDNLIERMRSYGLTHWVQSLPRHPDAETIERALYDALLALTETVADFLPAQWNQIREWVRIGSRLLLVERLLNEPTINLTENTAHPMRRLAKLPIEDRRAALVGTHYQVYFENGIASLDRWLEEFDDRCPKLYKREAYVIRRVVACIRNHHTRIRLFRERVRAEDRSMDANTEWHLRDALAQRLRDLIGGDPFHAGLVLIYGLLELIQYERCRALLIARSRGWSVATVMMSA